MIPTTAKYLPTCIMGLMALVAGISVLGLYSDSREAKRLAISSIQTNALTIATLRQRISNNESRIQAIADRLKVMEAKTKEPVK